MVGKLTSARRRLATVLSGVFVLATVMGPGPGIYLINPDPGDPNATVTFLGMPAVYVWAVSWCFVQAVVVVIAYLRLWNGRSGEGCGA